MLVPRTVLVPALRALEKLLSLLQADRVAEFGIGVQVFPLADIDRMAGHTHDPVAPVFVVEGHLTVRGAELLSRLAAFATFAGKHSG